MKPTNHIATRFREVILNGTWVAHTNFKDQLKDLNWKTATTEIDSLNSIALLTQHVHYYIAGLINVFKDGSLVIKDKFSFDFPPIQSQKEWELVLSRFWRDAEEFAILLEQLPEQKLEEPFVDEKYGNYRRNINGLIEHSYYHLGQIVLIKKLLQHIK